MRDIKIIDAISGQIAKRTVFYCFNFIILFIPPGSQRALPVNLA